MEKFNSKILLFGEYTILNGSMALAIPFSKFSGHLVLPSNNESSNTQATSSNQNIKKWVKYLSGQKSFKMLPNAENLLSDALMGLHFDSNILQGYGIGSSGALTAAIYNQYFCKSEDYQRKPPINLQELKNDLSLMEAYFHVSSSGIDPLVSYLNEPIWIKGCQISNQPISIPKGLKIFLIDTGSGSNTGNLVQLYHKKSANPKLQKSLIELTAIVDKAVLSLETNFNPFDFVQELSILQRSILKEMFVFNESIKNALSHFKETLCIKLCGSGGGGFLLGFAKSKEYVEITKYFFEQKVSIISVEN